VQGAAIEIIQQPVRIASPEDPDFFLFAKTVLVKVIDYFGGMLDPKPAGYRGSGA